ncbi:hypothetical protein NL676_002340 [Syzygium grande]|nr:hypothetical protein NL676_002340 [Syzygium grande]
MARLPLLRSPLLFFLVVSGCFAAVSLAGGEGSLRPNRTMRRRVQNYRCSATSHRKPCLFFCNKCCAKCLCVPSGTDGHKEECPCYNNWTTKEGKPKCP